MAFLRSLSAFLTFLVLQCVAARSLLGFRCCTDCEYHVASHCLGQSVSHSNRTRETLTKHNMPFVSSGKILCGQRAVCSRQRELRCSVIPSRGSQLDHAGQQFVVTCYSVHFHSSYYHHHTFDVCPSIMIPVQRQGCNNHSLV